MESSISQVRWLGWWISDETWVAHALSSALLHLRSHSRGHHASLGGGSWSGVMILESLLELDSFNVLLVFNLFLNILISLQKFVMLGLSKLEALIQVSLQFLFKCIHFILLFLNEFGLGSNNFLRSLLHVLLSFFGLELLASNLDLMSILISTRINKLISEKI